MIKLFTIFFLAVSAVFIFNNGEPIKHSVKLKHPGISLTDSVEQLLYQEKGGNGKPDRFYMIVKTVVCGDRRCRIDDVKIYWNELGFYDVLVLPIGVKLEKDEGKIFTKEDYDKLDRILADKKSGLKNVYKEQVVGSETSEGVDAVSGATIILSTNAYVKGAVWTCYTLWHWANGGVYHIIRNITGDSLSLDSLRNYINNGDKIHQFFALEQMMRRKNYDAETVKLIMKMATSNDNELQQLMVQYFEKANSEIYYTSIESLLAAGNQNLRLLSLSSLLKTKMQAPTGYYKDLSKTFSGSNEFQEVDLFLKILDNSSDMSAGTIKNLMPLLDNRAFIIARRAYWFLVRQKLSVEQEKILLAFREKNIERL